MTTTLTLTQLIDRTLFDLGSPGELGRQIVVGSSALTTTSTTTMTLADATGVNTSDVLELGDELVLVTAKSSDAVPVLTVSRGYYGTTAGTAAEGDVGTVNPSYPRRRIAEAIRRSFSRIEAFGIVLVKTVTKNTADDETFSVELPADCREVYEVLYQSTIDGRIHPLTGWEPWLDVPATVSTTGKLLNVSRSVTSTDDLEVVYRAPYRWSSYPDDPVGDSTIEVPEGVEDLPSLYAAAWLTSSREVSRLELDRSEEWGRTVQVERGVSSALVRAKWQEFYRALDEARRLNHVPQPVVYRRRGTV